MEPNEITIEFITVDPDDLVYRLGGLVPDENYLCTVQAADGREVDAQDVPSGSGEVDVQIGPAMANQLSGMYEIRVFGPDQFVPATSRGGGGRGRRLAAVPAAPLPDAVPVTRSFAFVPVAAPAPAQVPAGPIQTVQLARAAVEPTADEILSVIVRAATTARGFNAYDAFITPLVCGPVAGANFRPDAFRTLVDQTRVFLAGETRTDVADMGSRYFADGITLPYIAAVARRFPGLPLDDLCAGLDTNLLDQPFPVELIWSYWMDEGGLAQTLNLVLARFQNRRSGPGPEPLARFDLMPLRPLRNLLYQWSDDEINRLTVRRRAVEYEYEYGLRLIGRAIPPRSTLVERRSQFLESFHTLLYEAQELFRRDDDSTISADAFPVLNALRDTHLVLAEGAHNQYGDLPTEAREQMMVMQWLLRQDEMRDFLGGRPMIPYQEPWQDRVDSMKTINGWSPISITYFTELAIIGEQLLLTIRFGNWNDPALGSASALNWARTWRNEIQRYVHAYRTATGVDLAAGVDSTMPALLLRRREPTQARRA